MAYGQTGAGKTFTMSGSNIDYKYRGIIPRIISSIFSEIGTRYDQQITVKVSYLEIYNEVLTDLLASALQPELPQNLVIQEDIRGGVYVKNIFQKVCGNEEECLSMLFEGETHRTITEHKLNKSSTRSHCIFTIYLESRSRVESTEKVTIPNIQKGDIFQTESCRFSWKRKDKKNRL